MKKPPPTRFGPNLYRFNHYADFMKAYVAYKREMNPSWSLAVMAKQLKISGSAVLVNCMNERRVPAPALAQKLARYWELTDYETEFWLLLVETSQRHLSPTARNSIRERIAELRPPEAYRQVDLAAFQTIARPHHYAIRELVNLPHFEENPAWIAKRLFRTYPLSENEITFAIQRLLNVGLLRRNADGRLETSDRFYETPTEMPSEALKLFHEDVLRMAGTAVRAIPPEERHFGAITFAMKKSDLPGLKASIETYLRRTLNSFDTPDGDEIYQFSLQLLPLSDGGLREVGDEAV